MRIDLSRRPAIAAALAACLGLMASGCSEGERAGSRAGRRVDDFRKVRFAGAEVVVPFRRGLETATVGGPAAGPVAGDRVALSDAGEGEVFLATDLDALKFYHSSPGPDQVGRFRLLGDEGRLFVAARGTVGSIRRVVEGELPGGLKAVELDLSGEAGGPAWVSETFVRRAGSR